MKRLIAYIIPLMLTALALAGCGYELDPNLLNRASVPEENPAGAKEQETEKEQPIGWEDILEAPAAPENIKDIVTYPAGRFASVDIEAKADKVMEDLTRLPKLEGEADKEKLDAYYNVIYSYFAEKYRSPADLLDNWDDINFGGPDGGGFQFKENFNVEIILDASGSMRSKMDNVTRMDVAKKVIADFMERLPKNANVGLRVYGHKGSGSEADKQLSCGTTEMAYGMGQYQQQSFMQALNSFEPAGWTPIGSALKAAMSDFAEYPAETNTNIIFLVSDGIETCEGDPVTAAKSIAESGIEPLIHVIGFDVDSEGQKQLTEVAKAANGTYHDAKSQAELEWEMNKTQAMAAEWEEWLQEASQIANQTHSDRMMEVLNITNDWSYSNADQMKNTSHALEALRSSGHISEESFHYLYKKMNDHFNNVNEMLDTFSWQLKKLNDTKYFDMIREINAQFERNTDAAEEEKKKKKKEREENEKNVWW